MCLIIHNPEGKPLDKEKIKNASSHNDDGFGIMWVEENKVKTFKGLLEFKEIWDILEKFEGHSYAIHFRLRTHGELSEEGCHPHEIIKDKLYLMHNGVLHGFGESAKKSDTQLFVDSLKEKIEEGLLEQEDFFNPEIMKDVANAISSNKLLFMGNDGRVSLANENMGSWIDGCWYSNTYSTYGYVGHGSSTKWHKYGDAWIQSSYFGDDEEVEKTEVKKESVALLEATNETCSDSRADLPNSEEDERQYQGNGEYYASKGSKPLTDEEIEHIYNEGFAESLKSGIGDDPTPEEIDNMINDDIDSIIQKHANSIGSENSER